MGRWKGGKVERGASWAKRWLQMSIESECGRGGRGYGELTRVSRTYLRCQSKSQPGNLCRRGSWCDYGHLKVSMLVPPWCELAPWFRAHLKQIVGLTESWSAISGMCRRWRWGRTQERGYSEVERYFLGVASGSGRGRGSGRCRACLCLCAFIYDLKFE